MTGLIGAKQGVRMPNLPRRRWDVRTGRWRLALAISNEDPQTRIRSAPARTEDLDQHAPADRSRTGMAHRPHLALRSQNPALTTQQLSHRVGSPEHWSSSAPRRAGRAARREESVAWHQSWLLKAASKDAVGCFHSNERM